MYSAKGQESNIPRKRQRHNYYGVCLLKCLAFLATFSIASNATTLSSANRTPAINSAQAAKSNSDNLTPGQSIRRKITGGESHSYIVSVVPNQYLHVVVNQIGIDVVLSLYRPDGKKVAEVDSPNYNQGPEQLSAISEIGGLYRLEIRSLESSSPSGEYELKISEFRPAVSKDRDYIEAETAFNEAEMLSAQWTAESLKQSIDKYIRSISLWQNINDKQRESVALYELGRVYAQLARYDEGLAVLDRALKLSEEMDARETQAIVLNDIGSIYFRLGEIEKAYINFERVLTISGLINNKQIEVAALSNLGNVLFNKGENQKALDEFYKVLTINRELNNYWGQSEALNSIGLIYHLLGESQKAIDFYNQALALIHKLGSRQREAVTLYNIGRLYFDLGDYQKALNFYVESLALIRSTGDVYLESYSLYSIGATYVTLGDYQKALDNYNRALALSQKTQNRSAESLVLSGLGTVYSLVGDKQKAVAYLERALMLSREINDRGNEARILYSLGAANYLLGKRQEAFKILSETLMLSRAINDQRSEASALYWLAQVERNSGNLDEARRYIEKALDLSDSLRLKINAEDLRAFYFASVQKYYELYIDLLIQINELRPSERLDALALQVSERARARSLLELLSEAKVDVLQGVDPSVIEKEKSLRQLLNSKADRRINLLSGKYTQEQVEALNKEIEKLFNEYETIRTEIRRQSPHYSSLMQPQPLTVKEIQEQVVDNDTLLLEFSLGEERSFLWAVTPTSATVYILPKRAEIEEAVHRFNVELREPDSRLEAGFYLSNMLLGPVAQQLSSKRLLIVAQGSLLSLPFGALPAPARAQNDVGETYDPLILKHEIIYSPSASVLAVLRQELAGRKPASKTVAVFADPVFDKNDARINMKLARTSYNTDSQQSTQSFPRLFTSRWEAEQIVSLIPSGQAKLALDFQANLSSVMNAEISQYKIIHFATHGLFDNAHPELSGIVLSAFDQQGRPQDGILRANEIFNLKLNADLVVLSGCSTGLGKTVEGEGIIGLTRGFMYAGAPRVVVSLWNVDDRATAELMTRFYKSMLKDGLTPAAALRAAQLEVFNNGRWRHPYYWAPFVLQGEWK